MFAQRRWLESCRRIAYIDVEVAHVQFTRDQLGQQEVASRPEICVFLGQGLDQLVDRTTVLFEAQDDLVTRGEKTDPLNIILRDGFADIVSVVPLSGSMVGRPREDPPKALAVSWR